MSYREEDFGRLESGESVKRITIENDECSVSILDLGAIIQSFCIKAPSGVRDVVVGSPTISGYIQGYGHMGEVVAPYANRIKDAKFTFQGKEYVLDKNNNGNNLHSGTANLGRKIWNISYHTSSSVVLTQVHRDMDGGFPGNISVSVFYLLEGTRLSLSYTMSSDKDCVVNPTNHVYFNLNKDPRSDVSNHMCMITASKYVAVDEKLIPTGLVDVGGTDFDFRTPTRIGSRMGGLYDYCFVFDSERKAVVSVDDLEIACETDRPGVHFYSGGNYKNPESKVGPVGKLAGFCLETSIYPDAVNHPEFPSAELKAGDILRTTTSYTLRLK